MVNVLLYCGTLLLPRAKALGNNMVLFANCSSSLSVPPHPLKLRAGHQYVTQHNHVNVQMCAFTGTRNQQLTKSGLALSVLMVKRFPVNLTRRYC